MKRSHKKETPPENQNTQPPENKKASGTENATIKVNNEEDLPGYPYYPASEDILNPSNEMERLDVDVENIARSGRIDELALKTRLKNIDQAKQAVPDDLEEESELGKRPVTEADLTKEDLLILGDKDRDMDMGDDESLKELGLAKTGEDLDVPGEELDDIDEELGEEDEENNYYSLGGDNHENLEENS